jgi:hypothetical protein
MNQIQNLIESKQDNANIQPLNNHHDGIIITQNDSATMVSNIPSQTAHSSSFCNQIETLGLFDSHRIDINRVNINLLY